MDTAASHTVAGGGIPFSYDPLPGPGKLTRLATLHPALPNENGETPGLCLSLRQVDLDDHPRYSAVSYVWGSAAANHAISVNSKTFYINSNLHEALVHTRANLVDGADCVRGDDFATWDAFPVLKSLEAWEEVHEFFKRPFWYRLWIVQEVILSRNDTILCGDEQLSWVVFERAYRKWYREFRLRTLKAPGYFDQVEALAVTRNGWGNLSSMMMLRNAHQDGGEMDIPPILDELASTWRFEVAKPVDRIYGLLSITDHAVIPDCALSAEEVYTAFARSQIEEGRTEVVLFAGSGVPDGQDKTCALPSWVPDWHGRAAGKLRPNYRSLQAFLGAGRRPSEPRDGRVSISLASDVADALSAQAVLGPQVVRTAPPGFLESVGFWREFRGRAFEATYAGTGMSELQALFRTLLFDTAFPFFDYVRLSGLDARYYELVVGFLAVMARALEIAEPDDGVAWDHRPIARELFSMPRGQFTDDEVDTALLRLFQRPADSTAGEGMWPIDSAPAPERDLLAGFNERHTGHTGHQCFFWTADGYFGLGPPGCREGDIPSVFVGGDVLHMLRQHDGYYEHVGPCFVLGLMDGELLQRVDDGVAATQEIIIR
ncbi:hypothetical protein C8A01DRAFT_37688 [Parachaetomium inaequale]|uniref:Heterokaryon incompatibility domain-containing protein n=1 Tax=Parachaetomium inaequale TaxID=2588326 RepID=A0AAN6PCK4_9PEZI|nr:hypothetical protein C8A01DRAFT_37688 [Parachaetomium inaequale]